MLAALRGRRRHRQRRVPSGRLHAAQPQGARRRASAMPSACTASPAASAGRWRRRCWCRSRWRSRGASRWRAPARWRSSCWSCCGSTARSWRSTTSERRSAEGARRRRRGRAAASPSCTIPAVWMCFGFFFFYAVVAQRRADLRARGGAPAARRADALGGDVPDDLHGVRAPAAWWSAASSPSDPARCERIVGVGFGVAAVMALMIGFAPLAADGGAGAVRRDGLRRSGIAGPSRDLIVKRAAPDERDRPRLRRRLFRARHRPGDRAAGLRPADGPASAGATSGSASRSCRRC